MQQNRQAFTLPKPQRITTDLISLLSSQPKSASQFEQLKASTSDNLTNDFTK